jgi:hypothetical protein
MKIDYNSPTPLQVHTIAEMMKHEASTFVVTYNNKSKKWWISDGREFTSPKLAALHLMEQVNEV